MLKTTSCTVIGWPSENRTPWWSLNTHVLGLVWTADVASQGTTCRFGLTCISDSQTLGNTVFSLIPQSCSGSNDAGCPYGSSHVTVPIGPAAAFVWTV